MCVCNAFFILICCLFYIAEFCMYILLYVVLSYIAYCHIIIKFLVLFYYFYQLESSCYSIYSSRARLFFFKKNHFFMHENRDFEIPASDEFLLLVTNNKQHALLCTLLFWKLLHKETKRANYHSYTYNIEIVLIIYLLVYAES